MEAAEDLEEYHPRKEEPLLVLTSEPAKVPFRVWAIGAGVGAISSWQCVQAGRPDIIAAAVVPMLFLLLGVRVLTNRPVRGVLRFFPESVELDTDGRGWVRVAWPLITRLVKDGAGGATLDTGTFQDGGRTVGRLTKFQLDELLAARLLPAHVEHVEAPVAPARPSAKKTFALWLALVVAFVVIYQLVQK